MPMTVCPSCEELNPTGGCVCPSCGHKVHCAAPKLSAAAVALGLFVGVGAPACGAQAEYAAPVDFQDNDGDGYDESEDCDDGDPDVNPAAEEIPDDGVDSNCDGEDNT